MMSLPHEAKHQALWRQNVACQYSLDLEGCCALVYPVRRFTRVIDTSLESDVELCSSQINHITLLSWTLE